MVKNGLWLFFGLFRLLQTFRMFDLIPKVWITKFTIQDRYVTSNNRSKFFMITIIGSLKWRTKVIEQQSLGLRDSESSGKRGNSVRYSLLSTDYWWVNSGEWPHRTARASMFSSVKNLLPGLICINWVVSDAVVDALPAACLYVHDMHWNPVTGQCTANCGRCMVVSLY